MNFAVRHTKVQCFVSQVLQNMNFAVRHTTCCVSDVLLISLSPVFIEITKHELCC